MMGTSGHAGTHNSVSSGAGSANSRIGSGMEKKESKIAGMAMGSNENRLPGVGNLKPSMGSGKVGE